MKNREKISKRKIRKLGAAEKMDWIFIEKNFHKLIGIHFPSIFFLDFHFISLCILILSLQWIRRLKRMCIKIKEKMSFDHKLFCKYPVEF